MWVPLKQSSPVGKLAKASKEESIMIGDSLEADIDGALSFGIDAIYFNEQNSSTSKSIYQVNHWRCFLV